MKLLSTLFSILLVLGVGFLIFESSISTLYQNEKEINSSIHFVKNFSFSERKDAFISRLQFWFREDDSFTTGSGEITTSSGTVL